MAGGSIGDGDSDLGKAQRTFLTAGLAALSEVPSAQEWVQLRLRLDTPAGPGLYGELANATRALLDEGTAVNFFFMHICHGVAGVLAITDAFATHADLSEAGLRHDRLSGYLIDRIDAITKLGRTGMRLLSGAAGTVAVLLTATGAPRTWLPMIGLR